VWKAVERARGHHRHAVQQGRVDGVFRGNSQLRIAQRIQCDGEPA
jgi:hypothetical protein